MDNYIPDIIEERYAKFLLALEKCPACHQYMIVRPHRAKDTFPRYYKLTFDAQVKAAGFVIRSDSQADNEYICEDCARAGKAYFICALCEQKKSSDKIQERIGDPPEFLCTDCYGEVSAREWESVLETLTEAHRWDFG